MLANSLIELDRAHLVHPVASYRGHEAMGVRVLKSARGATVTDATGHTLLDGFAGLWCVNAGYGQDSIVEAAAKQLRELPYATGYFGLGSEPAIRLAARLAELAPGDLNHIYFTLGGSDAVDSTVRFIRYYYHAKGTPQKDQFISVEYGYHGSSTAGSGLTALPVFHAGFGVPYDWQHKIPSHYPYRNPVGSDPQAIIDASVAALRAKIAELGADRVAAFYVEPIQGSGGVLVPPAGWLKAMRAVCAEHDILFVVDEVITGFGRTGPLFACEDDDVVPDLMTTAKGLTSGYVPMGAVFMSDRRLQHDRGRRRQGGGRPWLYLFRPSRQRGGRRSLACDLYEDGLARQRAKGRKASDGRPSLALRSPAGRRRSWSRHAGRRRTRHRQGAQDAACRRKPIRARRIFDRAWENGLVIRAFANGVLGYAPPLCCTDGEIDAIVERTRMTLDQTLEDKDVRAAMK